MRALLPALFLALGATALPGQVLEETFPYPPTLPVIPNWTVHTGTWQVNNFRLRATSGALWAYITRDNHQARDCVLEGEFFAVGSGLQFGGLAARVPANSGGKNLVMGKVQGSGTFDHIWVYERGSSSKSLSLAFPATTRLNFRMVVLDSNMWCQVDGDQDGIYEVTTNPLALTQVTTGGGIGMAAYQTAEMDNFKFYDAVLWNPTQATPRIGTSYKMHLRVPAPAPSAPRPPFFCLVSRYAQAIPIGTRKIPLGFDFLWETALSAPALFSGFTGLIDAKGDAFPTFVIPNDPILVGLGLFFAGFTLDGKQPFGIGHISNNHHVKIQP